PFHYTETRHDRMYTLSLHDALPISLVQNADGTYTFARQQTQVQYNFSPTGQLMSEVDLNGYTTTLTYDGSARLSTVTEPAGRSLDRKSTRLNSSHVKSSYAVFCLKE